MNTPHIHIAMFIVSLIDCRYDSMLSSALLCLNNTVPQVHVDKFGGLDSLKSLLSNLIASLSVKQSKIVGQLAA